MDDGETIEQALVREMREELGIEVRRFKLFGVYSGPHRDPRGTSLGVAFEVLDYTGEPKPVEEASELRFFGKDEAASLQFGFDHRQIVSDFFGGKNR